MHIAHVTDFMQHHSGPTVSQAYILPYSPKICLFERVACQVQYCPSREIQLAVRKWVRVPTWPSINIEAKGHGSDQGCLDEEHSP